MRQALSSQPRSGGFVKELNRTAKQRDNAAAIRDTDGNKRDAAAIRRDAEGHRRDAAAGARDLAGELRDGAATQRDLRGEDRDDGIAADSAGDLRDVGAEHRDRTGDRRDDAAEKRDEVGDRRDDAAEQRDVAGERRDVAAEQRDVAGERRDVAAEQRDVAGERRDAAAHRSDRSTGRARDVLIDIRDLLSVTRRAGAAERLRASDDRRAAADERVQAGLDRDVAMSDRTEGASGREESELDRDISTNDRVAASNYRRYATELATSLEFGWTVRQLDPPEFLFVSPGCMRILGLDPDGPATTLAAVRAMIHPDDTARVATDFWDAAEPARMRMAELRLLHPSGEYRWMRLTSHPVLARDGSAMRATDTLEDITEQKISAEAVIAQREADRANVAKHRVPVQGEPRTADPLNAVLGFGQLLQLGDLSEGQADAVDHIVGAGRHLMALIDDLLDITNIEAGHLSMTLGPVGVDGLLVDVIGLMKPAAVAAEVEILLEPTATGAPLYVQADRRRLRQVLLNVLSNAVKYNSSRGTVTVRSALADQSHVHVEISDTGVGIDPEYLPRLFTAFDRLGHRSSDIEGTGIGLALSKRLLEVMGGDIAISSALSRGTTVNVTLPLSEMQPA